jgi:nucleoside-diphosphate-sugar epimerase
MVVGNGLLAKRFAVYQSNSRVLIFASGVSNSKLADAAAFEREERLLSQTVAANPQACCVYFSTCSIADPSLAQEAYVAHKLHMEQVVQAAARQWLIFRVSNLVGNGGNPATVFNFLVQCIAQQRPFVLWGQAYRNLLDVDDAYALMDHFISTGRRNCTINIANTGNFSSAEMVKAIELFTHRQGVYTTLQKGTAFDIDTTEVQRVVDALGVNFGGNYLLRLLNKYYHAV